jgi:hypothetical protein
MPSLGLEYLNSVIFPGRYSRVFYKMQQSWAHWWRQSNQEVNHGCHPGNHKRIRETEYGTGKVMCERKLGVVPSWKQNSCMQTRRIWIQRSSDHCDSISKRKSYCGCLPLNLISGSWCSRVIIRNESSRGYSELLTKVNSSNRLFHKLRCYSHVRRLTSPKLI